VTSARRALPHNLYTSALIAELERHVIEHEGIAGEELMERAGRIAFETLLLRWPEIKKLIVLCGSGNNGGDGYVLARLAYEADLQVTVMQMPAASKLRGEARSAWEKCLTANVPIQSLATADLKNAEVIVDGLLGTGLDRQLDEFWQALIQAINKLAVPVLSLDIPSGLHADTGCAMPIAVKADVTVSFVGLKQGLITAFGPTYCGDIVFSDLDISKDNVEKFPFSAQRIDLFSLSGFLRKRELSTHKGECGHVLIVGGDYGYAGSVRMAGEAAMRVGAGLVTIATRPEHALNIPLARPELMTVAVHGGNDLNALLERASVVVIGPGLGQSAWALELLAKVFQSRLSVIMDADALNLLALEPDKSPRWVLTPHPGEAARLLSSTTEQIQSDRFAAALAIQEKYDGICVLKGSGSLIVDVKQSISISNAGNPGMASAGMGDVLSGVIAGLHAQGLALDDAARVGVCLHAEAGDEAAGSAERGLLVSDLMPALRALVNP
jgi:ADP-dependent NAD(P)H-hydrate dehydratase / NAD(P)H-hydrate epimerase